MKKQQRRLGLCLALPLAAGLLFCYILPLLLAFWKSLFRGMGHKFVGLKNYAELLGNDTFLLAVKNTVLFWAVGITLNLLLGLAIALLCSRLCGRWLQALTFLPAMIPAACAVAMAQLLLDESGFPLSLARLLGGRLHNWANSATSFGVLIALFLWKSGGYTVIMLTAALSSIPRQVQEAAMIDGARPLCIVLRIKLPLIRASLGLSALIAFVNSFKIFREAYLIGGAHPHYALYSIQHFLQNNFANLNYARLAAASIFIVLLIVTVSGLGAVLLHRPRRRGAEYERR